VVLHSAMNNDTKQVGKIVCRVQLYTTVSSSF
jgi:hypothetical protein